MDIRNFDHHPETPIWRLMIPLHLLSSISYKNLSKNSVLSVHQDVWKVLFVYVCISVRRYSTTSLSFRLFCKKNPKLMCQIVRLYIPGQLSMGTNTKQFVLHFQHGACCVDGCCRPESGDFLVTVGRTIKKLLFTTYPNIYDNAGTASNLQYSQYKRKCLKNLP